MKNNMSSTEGVRCTAEGTGMIQRTEKETEVESGQNYWCDMGTDSTENQSRFSSIE